MFNSSTLLQVKAFARQDGIILSLVWMLSMWLLLGHPESSWGGILMLSTPFFVGWRLKSFRDNALDGVISFRRGLCFCCYVFFYASVIFALWQIVYFSYLDKGSFLSTVHQGIETLRPYYEQNNLGTADLEMSEKMLELMSPKDLVMTFFIYNLAIGLVASLLLALIYRKL